MEEREGTEGASAGPDGLKPETGIPESRTRADALRWEASAEPLVAAFRGAAVEEVHTGIVAVAGPSGRLLGVVGDPLAPVLLRSAAKPFQAFALVASGAAEAFDLTDQEIAVICASHAGEERHVRLVSGLLQRLGLTPEHLVCGTHPPFSRSVRAELQRAGEKPSVLQNNCSGKHAGMLAFARFLDSPLEGYADPSHPVQREIASAIAGLLGRDSAEGLLEGVDGCGVPVLLMSALEAATLFARLMDGAHPALARVRDAMLAHPDLVGGEGRFDTRCMHLLPGFIVSKVGAAGAQGLGLGAGKGRQVPVGCFIKLTDGTADVVPLVAGAFLRAWGEEAAGEELGGADARRVRSLVGHDVGRLEMLHEDGVLRRRETRATDRTAPESALTPVLRPVTGGAGERVDRLRTEGIRVEAGGGRERAVARFLRVEWPAADQEILGDSYDWRSEAVDFEAREGRHVIGVLRGRVTGGVATVDELIVHHEYRRRGVGGALLALFEEEAAERHCHKVSLRTPADSEAEAFYRGERYVREYRLPRHHYGHDYVGMAKHLL
jgi:L-asparaginase II/GNAT superfamily N-acetyltransferase